jgi:hypothetical protein
MTTNFQFDPVTTNFKSYAWDDTITQSQEALLDATYVQYPTAQGLVNFPNGLKASTISSSATLSINAPTLNLGSVGSTINLNASLTPLYSYPVATTRIGNILTATATSIVVAINTNTTLVSLSIPAGVWVLTADADAPAATNFTRMGFSLTTNSLTGARGVSGSSNNNAQTVFCNSCITISNSAATIYFGVFNSTTAITVSNATITATRIS